MLIKAGEPIEVAHIHPCCWRSENRNNLAEPSFSETLRQFWSQERVDAWYDSIFPGGTEACYNLMCLCPNAHAYWGKAYFALKPIGLSTDKKRLEVQFFWLTKSNRASQVAMLQRPLLPVDLDQGPNVTRLSNVQTDRKICSGDQISLETDDPITNPLPDLRLLDMQWMLHRVQALSAAAQGQDD